MNIRGKIDTRWQSRALASSAIALLGLVCWILPPSGWLDHFSYDLPFALRSGEIPSQAVIVYMDDDSRARLNQPVQGPWDRALHAKLLKGLFDSGARAVIFDILFDSAWPDKSVDNQFAAVIKAYGKVSVGASVQFSGGNGKAVVGKLLRPLEPLASAAPWGVAEFPLDSDGVVRRHFYDETYTNLAWQAAALVGCAPANRDLPRWLNFYSPGGDLPHMSYWRALDPSSFDPGTFSNKVVFVGMAPIIDYQGSRSSDEVNTPYTRWNGTSSPGVEIQTTAFLNLVRGDWMQRLPPLIESGLFLATGVLLGLLGLFRPLPAFMLGGVVGLAALGGGILMALNFHEWFCWAIIPGVQVPAALVWYTVENLNKNVAEQPVMKSPTARPEAINADGRLMVPDHELVRFLAKGGYGEVWLARNALGTYRAVKIIYRRTFEDEGPFEREYRGIQAFEPISRSHEGFVDILHVGRREEAGYFYYVMELADDQRTGQTIEPQHYVPRTLASEISQQGRIAYKKCVQIGIGLTSALKKLHGSGLVHRDIKPGNIVFIGGTAKLADIGLVTEIDESATIVGTEGFMPSAGHGTPQADIYALGKTLYEAVMGRDRKAFPELPTTLDEDGDKHILLEFNEILLKACDPELEGRYANAREMHNDLERLARRHGIGETNIM